VCPGEAVPGIFEEARIGELGFVEVGFDEERGGDGRAVDGRAVDGRPIKVSRMAAGKGRIRSCLERAEVV
jgi:hypothetical protein